MSYHNVALDTPKRKSRPIGTKEYNQWNVFEAQTCKINNNVRVICAEFVMVTSGVLGEVK